MFSTTWSHIGDNANNEGNTLTRSLSRNISTWPHLTIFLVKSNRGLDGSHVVNFSYLEVYNETMRDLFSLGRLLVHRKDD
ncbi:Kinesin-like protein KIN-8A, partial [Mucuna pruriens]